MSTAGPEICVGSPVPLQRGPGADLRSARIGIVRPVDRRDGRDRRNPVTPTSPPLPYQRSSGSGAPTIPSVAKQSPGYPASGRVLLGDSASQPPPDGAEDRTGAFPESARPRRHARLPSEPVLDADGSYPLRARVQHMRRESSKRSRC
jgi:hypothetical protein